MPRPARRARGNYLWGGGRSLKTPELSRQAELGVKHTPPTPQNLLGGKGRAHPPASHRAEMERKVTDGWVLSLCSRGRWRFPKPSAQSFPKPSLQGAKWPGEASCHLGWDSTGCTAGRGWGSPKPTPLPSTSRGGLTLPVVLGQDSTALTPTSNPCPNFRSWLPLTSSIGAGFQRRPFTIRAHLINVQTPPGSPQLRGQGE